MHAGQVLSAEHDHDGDLRAGRVAYERADSFIFTETALFVIKQSANTADYILTALIHSFT